MADLSLPYRLRPANYLIKSVQFADLNFVADMAGYPEKSSVIAYPLNTTRVQANQLWTITPPSKYGSSWPDYKYRLQTTTGSGVPVSATVMSADALGTNVVGNASTVPWMFELVNLESRYFRIYTEAGDGSRRYWTLNDGTEKTPVVLRADKVDSQIWEMVFSSPCSASYCT